MANMWEVLSPEEKRSVAMKMVGDKERTNENVSRAMEALSNNPNLVKRFAKEAGIEGDEFELQDNEEEESAEGQGNANDIERTVNKYLGEADVQQTGQVSGQSDIPPPDRDWETSSQD